MDEILWWSDCNEILNVHRFIQTVNPQCLIVSLQWFIAQTTLFMTIKVGGCISLGMT